MFWTPKHSYIFLLPLLLIACQPDEPQNGKTPSSDSIPTVDPFYPRDTTGADTHRDYNFLFDLNSVPEVRLTFTEEQWNTYLSNFDRNANNALYVWAQWSFQKGDLIYARESVGVRPRGNTSRRRPEGAGGEMHQDGADWHHAHFGVKFTEAATGQRFFGVDRLILKWFNNDPTYVREIYCYDLFRRFGVWTAPRASYCRLSIYIEGDAEAIYMGVYEMVENPRKGWLDARLHEGRIPDKDGFLWKAQWGADLSDASTSKMGVSDDEGHYFAYNLKTKKSKLATAQSELTAFINEVRPLASGSEELKTWLSEHMDIDLFLRAYAVTVITGMWDDYWCNQNNYFFYFDSNHRFYFIPFDYDNTLGTGQENYGNPGTKDPLNWGPLDGSRLLMRKVMSIAEYKEQYIAYLHELAESDELFAPEGSMTRIRQWQAMVEPYVDNDTGEDCVIEDRPAGWGNYPKYRLFSGEAGDGRNEESNFFLTKIQALPSLDSNP